MEYHHQNQEEQPHVFYDFIRKVGDNGRYQWTIFFIVLCYWILSGFSLINITFLFLNPGFDCTTFGISEIQCQQYICSHYHDEASRNIYLAEKNIQSLTTQFGPYTCEQNYGLGPMRMIISIGNAIGMILGGCLVRHLTERTLNIIFCGCCLIGSIILLFSQSMTMACVGLFIIGFGSLGITKFGFSLMVQITQSSYLGKFTSMISVGYTLSAVVISLAYNYLQNWRSVTLCLLVLVSALILFLTVFFLEDSPSSMIKSRNVAYTCSILNRIGKINKGEENIISEEEVEEYFEELAKQEQRKASILDLFTYPSLRTSVIIFIILTFVNDIMVSSFGVITNVIGFNPTLNQVLMGTSELFSVPLLIILAPIIKRQLSGFVIFFVCFLITCILFIIQIPNNCENCSEVIIQMGLIMLLRFLINFQYYIITLNQAEFFPTIIKSVGLSVIGFFSAIGFCLAQVLFIYSQQLGINPFMILGIIYIAHCVLYIWVPETLQIEKNDEIEEVQKSKFLKGQ